MSVRIRLARHGQRNTPYYHIVAISARKRRDALPIEKLGEYDPIPRLPSLSRSTEFNPSLDSFSMKALYANGPVEGVVPEKKIVWNVDRIKWWLANGAEPTDTVVKLLEKGGVLTGQHPWRIPAKKEKPKTESKTA